MEPVLLDQTPLANYLKSEAQEYEADWVTPAEGSGASLDDDFPPPSPQFAPVGQPMVKKRFRRKLPDPLHLDNQSDSRRTSSIQRIQRYSRAVAAQIEPDGSRFLEQFRYMIVASQLLSGHSILSHNRSIHQAPSLPDGQDMPDATATSIGVVLTATSTMALALIVSWVVQDRAKLTAKRLTLMLILVFLLGGLSYLAFRQQRYGRVHTAALSGLTRFILTLQEFDSVTSATIALIQEVELVSKGYRISLPLPPISRIDDRSQNRRCTRLRKTLAAQLAGLLETYNHTSNAVKGFAAQMDLEKYYDIYDISDLDMSDARQGFSAPEFDDLEAIHALKIAAARFHTTRKMFLCVLLALEANQDHTNFLRWSTAAEGLTNLNQATQAAYDRLSSMLAEEESFDRIIGSPRVPQSPGRERYRSQLKKLTSLSTGIRGLQAKLVLMREESDKTLNKAEDVSELGANLVAQYDSIGQDLRMLTQTWEEGRAALLSGIDRKEKRLSSIGSVLSPSTSLSGLTTVEESGGGGVLEALEALTGERLPVATSYPSLPEPEAEVFEAVALPPRPRSLLTREERITQMREERERRELACEKLETSRGMLRELEMVINLRSTKPRSQTNPVTPSHSILPSSS